MRGLLGETRQSMQPVPRLDLCDQTQTDQRKAGNMTDDHDWVDQMLRDALKQPDSINFEEFDVEFEAVKAFFAQRNGRAVIIACACLALATVCLNGCSAIKIKKLDDEDTEKMRDLVNSLAGILPQNYFTYLPATIAGLLLRSDE